MPNIHREPLRGRHCFTFTDYNLYQNFLDMIDTKSHVCAYVDDLTIDRNVHNKDEIVVPFQPEMDKADA